MSLPTALPKSHDKDYSDPEAALAYGVLMSAVKSLVNCPKTLNIECFRNKSEARTRLKRALEALHWAETQPDSFLFWCDIADLEPDWMAERMKKVADQHPLLIKAWEAQNSECQMENR